MTDLPHYSPVDDQNGRPWPDGAPENWPGTAANNTIRAMMGALARFIRAADFVDLNWVFGGSAGSGGTAAQAPSVFVSNTQVTIGNATTPLNATGWMLASRRVRILDQSATPVAYDGFIEASTYDGVNTTTVTVTMDGGVVPALISAVLVNIQPTLLRSSFLGGAVYGVGGIRNIFVNGNLEIWRRGTALTPASTYPNPSGAGTVPAQTVGVANYLADRWYVNPAGAVTTQQRFAAPTGSVSRYSMQIIGNSGTLGVLFGQRIEASNVVGAIAAARCSFQCMLANTTGAALTPTLLVSTPNAPDNFAAVTQRIAQALPTLANNSVLHLVYSFAVGSITNAANGLMIELSFPSGALAANTQSVLITDLQFEASPVATPIEKLPLSLDLDRCRRYWEQTYNHGVARGTVTQAGFLQWGELAGAGLGTTWRFPVMRVAPTVVFYSPLDGSSGNAQGFGPANYAITVNPLSTGDSGIAFNAAAPSQNTNMFVHATANAEL